MSNGYFAMKITVSSICLILSTLLTLISSVISPIYMIATVSGMLGSGIMLWDTLYTRCVLNKFEIEIQKVKENLDTLEELERNIEELGELERNLDISKVVVDVDVDVNIYNTVPGAPEHPSGASAPLLPEK
jgi:NurA-like 5'-3' nuclease